MWYKVYSTLIEEIDAIDNGLNQAPTLAYNIGTHLSAKISQYNPPWNKPEVDESVQFVKAVKHAENEFLDRIDSLINIILPARDIVAKGFENSKSLCPSGEILKLDQFCPWKSHLYAIEEEQKCEGLVKFVLF